MDNFYNDALGRIKATSEDILVNGRIVSVSSENTVADASQVYDSNIKKDQQSINTDFVSADIKSNDRIDGIDKEIVNINSTTNSLKAKDEQLENNIEDMNKAIVLLDDKIEALPKYSTRVVDELPTENISSTTIYLLQSDIESENLYTEYIYINDTWEKLGEQSKLNLPDYINMVNVTYVEFYTMLYNMQLVPGQQYRITDYNLYLTEIYDGFAEVGKGLFDIIVTATSKNSYDNHAKATYHDGDTYFSYSNLQAWQIWYTVENDTEKYPWCSDVGTGVIYRMIDEFGNDIPYDFKHMKFVLDEPVGVIGDFTLSEFISPDYRKDSDTSVYTFCNDTYNMSMSLDASLRTSSYNPVCEGNVVQGTQGHICNNVFVGECKSNKLERGCFDNIIVRSTNSVLCANCIVNRIIGGGIKLGISCQTINIGKWLDMFGSPNMTQGVTEYNNINIGNNCSRIDIYCQPSNFDPYLPSNIIIGDNCNGLLIEASDVTVSPNISAVDILKGYTYVRRNSNDKIVIVDKTELIPEPDTVLKNSDNPITNKAVYTAFTGEYCTYSWLKTYIRQEKLIPGTKYVLTDYTFVPSTNNWIDAMQCGEGQFYVVLTAATNSTFNEEVTFLHNPNDSYFSAQNLEAWRGWYSVENDEEKYPWSSADGKGVIYRLIDDHGNDIPYDFKHIMFNLDDFALWNKNSSLTRTLRQMISVITSDITSDQEYVYTCIDNNNPTVDGSLRTDSEEAVCVNNTIGGFMPGSNFNKSARGRFANNILIRAGYTKCIGQSYGNVIYYEGNTLYSTYSSIINGTYSYVCRSMYVTTRTQNYIKSCSYLDCGSISYITAIGIENSAPTTTDDIIQLSTYSSATDDRTFAKKDEDGVIRVYHFNDALDTYTLPVASSTQLGGIKVNDGVDGLKVGVNQQLYITNASDTRIGGVQSSTNVDDANSLIDKEKYCNIDTYVEDGIMYGIAPFASLSNSGVVSSSQYQKIQNAVTSENISGDVGYITNIRYVSSLPSSPDPNTMYVIGELWAE